MTTPYLKGLAPTALATVKARAHKLGYLGDVSKMRAALVYEFGEDAPMPGRAFLQAIVDKRRDEIERFRATSAHRMRPRRNEGLNYDDFRVRGLV